MSNNAKPSLKEFSTFIQIAAKPVDSFESEFKFKPSIEKMMKAVAEKSGADLEFQYGSKSDVRGKILVGFQGMLKLEPRNIHKLLDAILDVELEEGIKKVQISVEKGCVI